MGVVSQVGKEREQKLRDEARHETIPCLCSASPFITDESRSPDERGTSKAKKGALPAPAAGYEECELLSPLGSNGFLNGHFYRQQQLGLAPALLHAAGQCNRLCQGIIQVLFGYTMWSVI